MGGYKAPLLGSAVVAAPRPLLQGICDPVCGAGLGARFRALSAAVLSEAAAAVLVLSTRGAAANVSFCGFSNASFPGGWGTGCPGRAVVLRILPLTNLYPFGCTHSPLTKFQPLADCARSFETLWAPAFFSLLDELFELSGGSAVSVLAKLARAMRKKRRRFICGFVWVCDKRRLEPLLGANSKVRAIASSAIAAGQY